MPSPRSLTRCLTLLLLLPAVSSCASTGSALQTYPPVALLVSEAAPVPTIDILTSAQANQAYQAAKDGWGQRAAAQVRAVCVWAKTRGMTDAPC